MSLFGQGAVNVAGHKVSYTLLAALAGIAGAILLVLQMRHAQSSVTAGSPATVYPSDTSGYGYGPSVYGQDFNSGLAAISAQLASIQSSQQASAAVTGTPANQPVATSPMSAGPLPRQPVPQSPAVPFVGSRTQGGALPRGTVPILQSPAPIANGARLITSIGG